MSKIVQLSEQVSNLIAAGEVVLGPESVVKELVENSIDAKANEISINLVDAGLSKIEIIDNGCGMDEIDAMMAFNRHATSKIKTAFDLSSINTLGFRGEALPSIASVSLLELYTKTSDQTYGVKVIVKAGKLIDKETNPCNTGTRIVVSNLFYNTPARLKYLKGPSVILATICNLVDKFALANPTIKFTLKNNDQVLLSTNGCNDLIELLSNVYGTNVSKLMNHSEGEVDGIKASIYFSSPVITRSRKNDITLIVNGRYVKSNQVNNAIIDAYRNYIPPLRYPVCLIDLNIDPLLIDINVHPQKMEIKFSMEQEVCDLVKETIVKGIKSLMLIPEVKSEEVVKPQMEAINFDSYVDFKEEKDIDIPKKEPIYEALKKEVTYVKEESKVTYKEEIKEEVKPERKLPYFEYIGQLSGTYLLFQNEEGLFLVDQHAAQERINYEKYYKMLEEPKYQTMDLLVPYSLTVTKEEFIALEDHLDLLESYGLSLEPSGINSFFVRKVPSWIKENNPELVIEKMLYFLLEAHTFDIGRVRDSLAKQMACKASIKANHFVDRLGAVRLMEELDKCDNPFNCPHGRPVFVKLTTYEIEKMFKRVV